jgi:hypothetical protein
LLAGYYEGKDLIFIAKIKNGFTPALRRQVAESFKSLKTALCPFANLPKPQNARRGEAITAEVMKRLKWLKPRLVAMLPLSMRILQRLKLDVRTIVPFHGARTAGSGSGCEAGRQNNPFGPLIHYINLRIRLWSDTRRTSR